MNPRPQVIAAFIWSNYNMNFILSKVKEILLVYYIINYTIKEDYNQYQKNYSKSNCKKNI